jgi:hypothetical protein
MYMGPSYMYFCKKKKKKLQFVFHCVNSCNVFLDLPSSFFDGPQKIICHKLWQFAQKTSVGSSHNGYATMGRSQQSQRDMARYKSELEDES